MHILNESILSVNLKSMNQTAIILLFFMMVIIPIQLKSQENLPKLQLGGC